MGASQLSCVKLIPVPICSCCKVSKSNLNGCTLVSCTASGNMNVNCICMQVQEPCNAAVPTLERGSGSQGLQLHSQPSADLCQQKQDHRMRKSTTKSTCSTLSDGADGVKVRILSPAFILLLSLAARVGAAQTLGEPINSQDLAQVGC